MKTESHVTVVAAAIAAAAFMILSASSCRSSQTETSIIGEWARNEDWSTTEVRYSFTADSLFYYNFGIDTVELYRYGFVGDTLTLYNYDRSLQDAYDTNRPLARFIVTELTPLNLTLRSSKDVMDGSPVGPGRFWRVERQRDER